MKNFKLVICVLFMLCAPVAYAKEIVWRVQSYQPESSYIHNNFLRFVVQPINKELLGTLRIDLHSQDPAKSLSSNKDAFMSVKRGAINGMFMAPLYWGDVDPVFAIIGDLVAAWPTPESYLDWYNNGGGQQITEKAYAKHGMKSLGVTQRPIEYLISRTPIKGVDDFKGKIIRIPSGAMTATYFEKLGAIPRKLQMNQVLDAFNKGYIDMADYSSLVINHSAGLYKIAPYTTEVPFHSMPTLDFVVQQKDWDALPPFAKDVVLKHMNKWQTRNLSELKRLDEKVKPSLRYSGVVFSKWSEDDIQKSYEIAKSVWESFAKKSPDAKEAVKSITDYLKAHNYLK